MSEFVPRVLSIAGTDPSGGAGIQADLKSITAAGGYGMCAVTALVAQNTQGVRSIHTPPVDFLREQLLAVSDDVEIDVVKIGMLGNAAIIDTVRTWLEEVRPKLVVLDPVMIATSGDRLLDEDALGALAELLPLATVITPNAPELALLVGMHIKVGPEATGNTGKVARDFGELCAQAQSVAARIDGIVIAKSGHLSANHADNAAVSAEGVLSVAHGKRFNTKNTHGTGCSLSSALATRLGSGESIEQALEWTTIWLSEAIEHADGLHVGHGHGPVDHSWRARQAQR